MTPCSFPAPSPLAGDCFAVGEAPRPLEDALVLIRERIAPVRGIESVALAAAHGRILAQDVTSPIDVPPHDNSAMDGYAVRSADTRGEGDGATLVLARRIAAGNPAGEPIPPGAAIRIFTGAPMPPGADAVAIQEQCVAAGDVVTVPANIAPGDNRREAGEDVRAGEVILTAGRRLRPADVSMAAATGHASLPARRELKVAVFSTGDELVQPGSPLAPGQIYDSNRFAIAAMSRSLGCVVSDLGRLKDDRAMIAKALEDVARDHDLILTSGGVSVGEEDHVRSVVQRLGAVHLWRLALKPGKPVALGAVRGAAFMGLPGNPVAALACFLILGRPLVHALQGRESGPLTRYRLPAAFTYARKGRRREFLRVCLRRDSGGRQTLWKCHAQGSGVLSSMVRADGLADIPPDRAEIREGERLDFIPFIDALW